MYTHRVTHFLHISAFDSPPAILRHFLHVKKSCVQYNSDECYEETNLLITHTQHSIKQQIQIKCY